MSVRTVQHPVDAARQAPAAPDREYGFFYPRWAVLAGILLVPTGIIGEVVKAYFDTHLCGLGSICRLDATPGVFQVLIIWAAFLVLWGVGFAVGHGPLVERVTDHTVGPKHPVTHFFWHLSHFERVTPFIYGFGGLALVGMFVAGAHERLDAAVFALGTVAVVVAGVTLIWWLRLLSVPYARPGVATVAVEDPETVASANDAALFTLPPNDAPLAPMVQPLAPFTPDYAAMPNYGDVPPSQYVPDAQPLTGAGTVLPAALPSAPRLDSLEPPPNPNIDMDAYRPSPSVPTQTAPFPPPPHLAAGGTAAPLPPQVGPVAPDTEAH